VHTSKKTTLSQPSDGKQHAPIIKRKHTHLHEREGNLLGPVPELQDSQCQGNQSRPLPFSSNVLYKSHPLRQVDLPKTTRPVWDSSKSSRRFQDA
jgi:hypothetical protein